ncbi:MAG: putative Ig domain-containing protein [Methylacidiphilales bacterium]|nr:putative Ig domain-containing protein [Candidatus Methylacidiphilales bacterium]
MNPKAAVQPSTYRNWTAAGKGAMRLAFAMLALQVSSVVLHAETAADHAVQASAIVSESPARITLSWPGDPNATGWTVERKLHSDANWGTPTSLPAGTTNWADNAASLGALYEYRITKQISGYTSHWGDSAASLGYLCSGIRVALPDHRGTVILLVDTTMAVQLDAELARLKQDLAGDGWTVIRHDVSRGTGDDTRTVDSAALAATKAIIQADCNATPGEVHSLLLFGHIPVPYSGLISPDGHSEHNGAWSADVYYGDMVGTWTDSTVNDPHTDWWPLIANIPGDGKFDQSTPPQPITLDIGRVDMWRMPAFSKSEAELLRQYLNKDHNHRYAINVLPRRGLIDDRFSENGYYMAASGWRNLASFFGAANVTGSLDNFNVLGSNGYLCFYGCGSGDPTDYGLNRTPPAVSTSTFASTDPKAAFFMLWGSWFGDWNVGNNLLRAPLATTTNGLASVWSGLPNWFMHTMAMGGTIGETARMTQNNTASSGIYLPKAGSDGQIHVALMGDPTLRLFAVVPPTNVAVSLDGSHHPVLTWTASADASLGYHVFRGSSTAGPFVRVTTNPVIATTYTDSSTTAAWVYQVKSAKLETTNGGTYVNLSQGATVNMLPEITSPAAASVPVNRSFFYQIAANGSPTSFNATGLPAGLSVNTTSGAISGVPTAIGVSVITLNATSASGTGTAMLTLTVDNSSVGLPSPWVNKTVGDVGLIGTASYSGSTFTVQGSGTIIWGAADSCQYVYQLVSGDCTIIARVTSLLNMTDAHAQVGVMIRESLDTGAINANLCVSPSSGLIFEWRTAVNGNSSSSGSWVSGQAPVWLKLVRSGNTFTASSSTDGSTWTGRGSTTFTMSSNVLVGLPVCSRVNTVFGTATFDNVSVTTTSIPPVINSVLTAIGTAGSTFSYQITAVNNPTSYNATGLPAGLTVNTGTGLISGTPGAAGTSTATISATNTYGTGTAALTLIVAPSGGSLPVPWANADVGAVGVAGNASYVAGTFTVQGTGVQIWTAADTCQYLYQQIAGDCSITARVATLQNMTDPHAQAGVMMRESLAAGAINVNLTVSSASGSIFEWRSGTNSSSSTINGGWVATPAPPIWLRLVRSGNTFTGYRSADNITWTPMGSTTMAMATNVLIGLPVCSRVNTVLGTVTFDNVSVLALPAINSALTATATAGSPFSYTISATNSPASYSATGLPSGLSVNTISGLISGTPGMKGTSSVTISATNMIGTGSATLALNSLPASFATWKAAWFTTAQLSDPTVSGDLANPSGDGICNLLDYAFNLDPTPHNSALFLPQPTEQGGFLALTYTVNKSVGDLVYLVEVSGDLQNWNSGPVYTSSPVVLSDNGVTQTVQVTDLTSTSAASRRFIRLRVTKQ